MLNTPPPGDSYSLLQMDPHFSHNLQGSTFLRTFSGTGADDDIVVSSVRAYVSAMNKMIAFVSKAEKRAAHQQAEALQSVDGEAKLAAVA